MTVNRIQPAPRRMALALCMLCCLGLSAPHLRSQAAKEHGGGDKPTAADAQASTDKSSAEKPATDKSATDKPTDKNALPPLPPDAHVQQSTELGGKTLHY